MRTIADSSSLIALAKYYFPFDSAEALDAYPGNEIRNGSLILLDKVIEEVKHVSQGLAYDTFACLREKKVARSTVGVMPTQKFYHMLDNNFVDRVMKRRKFSDDEEEY